MTRALALVALVASVALFAGCAPAPQLPAPITPAEAQERMDANSLSWWQSMFPDEPMPEVRVIKVLDPEQPNPEPFDCIRDADIEGVTVSDNGWSYSGGGDDDLINRVQFVCSMRYPYDLSDPAKLGMLSEAELAWIWSYNRERLVPCLRMLGFTVASHDGDYAADSGNYWVPYYEMTPLPQNEGQWDAIDLRCPPSPIGPVFRPTAG